ncbi:uncharacterized protein LOC119074850 isoform X2 [Bradysia coprophila]|uniref:uncharacterized protein LOC119074850 isoform X2 n=1 Tax=Bradysia coprophila TaxID=38358 RepID=UPI00187D8B16|nr:uncharacterized protein LOC119074850 isoform X2 [Bradysia coprophila]
MKTRLVSAKHLMKPTVKMFYKSIPRCLLVLLFTFSACMTENVCENGCTTNSTIIQRSKRYLDFIPLSRMFFRANIKDNIVKVNQFWAQSYGFRANFPIENQKRTKRSDVYDTLSDLINQHGFDGRACILKTFCDASKALTPNSGMLFKMFKLIFSTLLLVSTVYRKTTINSIHT